MPQYPKLNFPSVHLRARHRGEEVEVWDSLRGIYLVLTPEEWVRQHLISYLCNHCGAEPTRVVEEYPVSLNGQAQRADVVVVDGQGAPLLLAECKATTIDIDEKTLAQAVRYNSVLHARYVVLTNGLRHYCWEVQAEKYVQLRDFPSLTNS